MGNETNLNLKSGKKFVTYSFMVIGLFVVLSYSFATIVLLSNNSSSGTIIGKGTKGSSIVISGGNIVINVKDSITISGKDGSSITISNKESSIDGSKNNPFVDLSVNILTGVHISVAILAILGFFWVVNRYYKKLYGTYSVKEEENLRKKIKSDIFGEVYLLIAKTITSDSGGCVTTLQKLLKELLEKQSKISTEKSSCCPVDKILLVDGDKIKQFTTYPQDGKS